MLQQGLQKAVGIEYGMGIHDKLAAVGFLQGHCEIHGPDIVALMGLGQLGPVEGVAKWRHSA